MASLNRRSLLYALAAAGMPSLAWAQSASIFQSETRLVTHAATGLRAVIARTPAPQTPPRACVGLYCLQGRIGEGREGLGHIAEHIAANTPRVVPNPHQRATIFQSNAFTRPTYTSFWVTIAPEGFRFALQSRLGMLTGLRYRASVMEEQRARVLNEFN